MKREQLSALILVCGSALGLVLTTSTARSDEPDHLPSLDELLGLDENGQPTASDQSITDPNEAELDQVLSPKQAGEAFSQAVGLMDQVATRIGEQNDLSVTTQRLQEDILRMLDQVIDSAENNNSGGGGSSSSQSSSSSSEQQPDQQQQPGETPGSSPSNESGDSPMPGGSSTARPGDEAAPDGVRWGSLPTRVRDALSQGISDQYSELYRAITEQYYKSLAEDED